MAVRSFVKRDDPPRIGVALRGDQLMLVSWRGRTYTVAEVLESRLEERRGWLRRGQRAHYRVTTNAGELELCNEGSQWYLLQVLVDAPDDGEFWLGDAAEHELASVKDTVQNTRSNR